MNALALTVTGITANNKEYDGNDTATLSLGGAVLHTPVSGDDVSLDALSSYSAHFNDKTRGKRQAGDGNRFGLDGSCRGQLHPNPTDRSDGQYHVEGADGDGHHR